MLSAEAVPSKVLSTAGFLHITHCKSFAFMVYLSVVGRGRRSLQPTPPKGGEKMNPVSPAGGLRVEFL